MSKSIQLTQSQIEAYQTGATMFMFTIDPRKMYSHMYETLKKNDDSIDAVMIREHAPIQKGDKDIYVKEEFNYVGTHGDWCYKSDNLRFRVPFKEWKPASLMTKEQSRYTIKECLDARVVRVQDICGNEKAEIMGMSDYLGYIQDKFETFYNNQLKELNIDSDYRKNDYVFLVEVTGMQR